MSHEPPTDGLAPPVRAQGAPAPAPAFALLTSDGYAVASTDVFTRLVGLSTLGSPAAAAAVAEISHGRCELIAFSVQLPDGSQADARVEAVNQAHERLTLLEVAVPRPSDGQEEITDWFARFGEDSKALIWLKDLEGRYLSVNGAYAEQLGANSDRVRGKADAELTQIEAIDGPRNKRVGGPEPVQLEYVIPAFDRRPAYTALRFPLNDASGVPVAVCGVASPADQADVAQAECERLLAVVAWLSGDPKSLRREVLADWGITSVQSQTDRPLMGPQAGGSAGSPVPALTTAAPPGASTPQPAPNPPQLPTEIGTLLASLQRQVSDLEAKVTTPAPAGAPSTPSAPVPDGRFELEQERRRHATDVTRVEAELEELRAQISAEQERTVEAQAARQMVESQLLRVSEQLAASQAQVAELRAALDAAAEQMTRLERAAAAATAAAASPIAPSTGPPAASRPAGPGQPPPTASGAPVTSRPGWDATAQARLTEGLRGCLNVRSIFSEAVRLIGAGGGWDLVVAWLPNGPDGRLSASATWVRSPGEMAALETALWQVRQSPSASAVGTAAGAGEITWISDPARSPDPHLAHLGHDGLGTVVLLPLRPQSATVAVLELASTGRAPSSPAAEAALRSMETEVAAAYQRVTDTASASQWGRRSR